MEERGLDLESNEYTGHTCDTCIEGCQDQLVEDFGCPIDQPEED